MGNSGSFLAGIAAGA